MDAGDLVPDEVVIGLVKERLQDADTANGFILDGFPRTSTQAVALDSELSSLERPLDAALLVDVDKEVIIKRLTSRRMCRDCGYIGSDADAACPKCNGEMYQRDDDNEATVRNRLDVYEELHCSAHRLLQWLRASEGDRWRPRSSGSIRRNRFRARLVSKCLNVSPHRLVRGFFYSRASSERVVRGQYGVSVSCKMIRYETY